MLRRQSHHLLAGKQKESLSLIQTAISVLHENNDLHSNSDLATNNSAHSIETTYGLRATPQTSAPWIDRDEERVRAINEHRHTEVYRELHGRPMRHSELGLYGGEAGFEKTPRVWIDPDNPHVKSLYNKATLSINARWARYGHFKRELHIIDVDKLCRHARMLPPCDKLLVDFVTARAALDDDGCSAILRHGARTLQHLVGTSHAESFFQRIQSCFERFLVAVAPPMYAGVRTHSDMIRCCTLMSGSFIGWTKRGVDEETGEQQFFQGKFDEGYYQYRQRAIDEANDARMRRDQLKNLTTNIEHRKLATKSTTTTRTTPKALPAPEDFDVATYEEFFAYRQDNDRAVVETSSVNTLLDNNNNNNNNNKNDGNDDNDDIETIAQQGILSANALGETGLSQDVLLRSHNDHYFELDSEFYDATIELCLAYGKHKECLQELRDLIKSRHRPRISSLTNALLSATALKDSSVGDDIPRLVSLYQLVPDARYHEARAAYCATMLGENNNTTKSTVRSSEQAWSNFLEAVSTPLADPGNPLKAGTAGLRSSAQSGERGSYNQTDNTYDPESFDAQGKVQAVTSKTVSWTLLALANDISHNTPSQVLKLLDIASSKGISCDYEQLTFALYYATKKATLALLSTTTTTTTSSDDDDGRTTDATNYSFSVLDLVSEIIRSRLPVMRVNLTPEMALLGVRALARLNYESSDVNTANNNHNNINEAVALALEIMSLLQSTSNHRSSSHFPSIFYELSQLLARAGAMATFSSTLRSYVLSRGETVQSWLLRTWLWCNSNAAAPNGSHHTTMEALQFLIMSNTTTATMMDENTAAAAAPFLTKELIVALTICRLRHGEFPERVKKLLNGIVLDSSSTEAEAEAVATTENENKEQQQQNQEGPVEGEKSLLELTEYLAEQFFKKVIFSGSSSSSSSTSESMMQNNNKEENFSLEMSLLETLGSTATTLSQGMDQQQHQQQLSLDEAVRDQKLALQILVNNNDYNNGSFSSTYYNACQLLSRQFLEYCSSAQDWLFEQQQQQQKQEEEKEEGDDKNKNNNTSDEEAINRVNILLDYAELFAGLPSEATSSSFSTLTAEFTPTPADLRDLRVKWTIDSQDHFLQRFGQAGKGFKPRPVAHNASEGIRPFMDSGAY